MLRTSTTFLAISSLVLSINVQAQVSDAIGDVPDPRVDIVETDISATTDFIVAELLIDDEFCPVAVNEKYGKLIVIFVLSTVAFQFISAAKFSMLISPV